jgi:hypothetical protein
LLLLAIAGIIFPKVHYATYLLTFGAVLAQGIVARINQ